MQFWNATPYDTIGLKCIYLKNGVYLLSGPSMFLTYQTLQHLRNLKNTFLCEVAQIYLEK